MEGVDLIKIDVEGGELEAFRGMRKTVEKFNPIIIMEVLPSYNYGNKFRIRRQEELAQLVAQLGYTLFHIKNENDEVRLKRVKNFPVHDNPQHSDYLLLPKGLEIDKMFLYFE